MTSPLSGEFFGHKLVGLKWLVFLMRALCLMGTSLGEDLRANIIKTHVLKEIGLLMFLHTFHCKYACIYTITTLRNELNECSPFLGYIY